MSDIVFYHNRRRMYLLIVVCLLFCGLGVFLMQGMNGYALTWLGINVPTRTLGMILTGFFGLGAIALLVKARDKRPALTITPTAIIDRTSMTAVGEIPLSEVTGVRTISPTGQTLILLDVRDPAFFIDRETSAVRRRILNQSLKTYATPVMLSGAFLDGGTEEVVRSLKNAVAGRANTVL